MHIKTLFFALWLPCVGHGMAEDFERKLLSQLLPPETHIGMPYGDFIGLNLDTLQMPGSEKTPTTWVLLRSPTSYKKHSVLFVDGRLASASCSWMQSAQSIEDFKRTKNLLPPASVTMSNIEIGKRSRMNEPVRLTAELATLKSGKKLLTQANEVEISMIVFDEALMKGKPSFLTFEELNSVKPYKSHFLEGVEFPPTKPQNNQIISVRDYLKDGFASSLPDRDLLVQNKPLDTKRIEIVKSVAVSEDPTLSASWLIIVVLIVAGIALLWLLVKRRLYRGAITIIALLFACWCWLPQLPFSSTAWKACDWPLLSRIRVAMKESLLEVIRDPGITKSQIRTMLGEPITQTSDIDVYEIGSSISSLSLMSWRLLIRYDGDLVVWSDASPG